MVVILSAVIQPVAQGVHVTVEAGRSILVNAAAWTDQNVALIIDHATSTVLAAVVDVAMGGRGHPDPYGHI